MLWVKHLFWGCVNSLARSSITLGPIKRLSAVAFPSSLIKQADLVTVKEANNGVTGKGGSHGGVLGRRYGGSGSDGNSGREWQRPLSQCLTVTGVIPERRWRSLRAEWPLAASAETFEAGGKRREGRELGL